jgi:LacI family transcriptional regulator
MTTIQEVAKRAGVSISTVSRVLNGTARVNGEVKERVYEAIQALDYRPNRAARLLRANTSRIIGLLISDLQNPFFMDIIKGVEDTAQRNGYSVILCNSDEDAAREQRYLEVLFDERVAGAIIVPTHEQLEGLTRFQEHDIPIVALDRRITVKGMNIDAVLADNVLGASQAVTHLIENGYRRIGVITGPKSTTTGRERLEGYRQALRRAGITPDPALERSGPYKAEAGRQLAESLLSLDPPIDALFACYNMVTLGAMDALYERKLRVPDDIALVGYDEMPWASLGAISLTTVVQPAYEMGTSAALRLFQRLQHHGESARQEIMLTPILHVRGSSQPRPSHIIDNKEKIDAKY